MIMRNLDASGDWTSGNGIANYVRDAAAVRLNIETTLKCWVGDCFFDLRYGVDYKRFLDTGQQKNLQLALQAVILGCDGVVSVQAVSVNFDPKTRLFAVVYSATDIFNNSFKAQVRILSGTGK